MTCRGRECTRARPPPALRADPSLGRAHLVKPGVHPRHCDAHIDDECRCAALGRGEELEQAEAAENDPVVERIHHLHHAGTPGKGEG